MWLRLVDITLSSLQWVERGEVVRLHQRYSAAGRGEEGWEEREGGREGGKEGGREKRVAVGHGIIHGNVALSLERTCIATPIGKYT